MFERIGAFVMAGLAWAGEVGLFGKRVLREALRPPFEGKELLR